MVENTYDVSRMHYIERGSGDRTMLLVHGMACDHHDWVHQIDHFARDWRVVAIDLPGHGESPPPTDGYSMDKFAAAIAAFIDYRKLGKPVVVGHSYGGSTALTLGMNHPDVPSALVALDCSFGVPPQLVGFLEDHYATLTPETFVDSVWKFSARTVDPGDDPAISRKNIQQIADFGLEKYLPMGRSIISWGGVGEKVHNIVAPTVYIGSSRPFADLAEIRRVRPDWYVGQTVGAGHWHQMQVPDQINAMIRDFLAQIDRGFPSPPPFDG